MKTRDILEMAATNPNLKYTEIIFFFSFVRNVLQLEARGWVFWGLSVRWQWFDVGFCPTNVNQIKPMEVYLSGSSKAEEEKFKLFY